MSLFSQIGVGIPVAVAAIATSAFIGSTPFRPLPAAAPLGLIGSCLPTPTHWWPLQRIIKESVHPTTNPADSLTAKFRIATRLPLLDSALVTTVANDSLCQIAAKRYGLYLYQDSLEISQITLLRLGDSAYAVGDIETRPGIDGVFLVLTPTWEWRGGNMAPVNWRDD